MSKATWIAKLFDDQEIVMLLCLAAGASKIPICLDALKDEFGEEATASVKYKLERIEKGSYKPQLTI
jgi:hypothetical protein